VRQAVFQRFEGGAVPGLRAGPPGLHQRPEFGLGLPAVGAFGQMLLEQDGVFFVQLIGEAIDEHLLPATAVHHRVS
jgi:hypothetical protein